MRQHHNRVVSQIRLVIKCKFCGKIFTNPSCCKHHFNVFHSKNVVTFNKLNIFPCWCSAAENVKKQRPHFHCPVCKHSIKRKSCLKKHIKSHFKQDNSSKINQPEIHEGNSVGKQTESGAASLDSKHVNEPDETNTGDDSKDSFKSGKVQTQHKCPFCGKAMLRRSIPTHCREKHNEEIVNAATFVDDIKGICFVRKSTHGGWGIHVTKKDL